MIKRIIFLLKDLDMLQKLLLLLISLPIILLFAQNFVLSSSFDVLMFRGVDDFAFHHTLRKNHENIINFKLDKLFRLYDYGYGWLFWITHIILTFPFYLISLLGSDVLLISTGRNISLAFMAGGCFYLFKIINKYTENKYIAYFAVLLFVSYPYFAYSAMSFRTIAQGSFFCILTFYLTVRNDQLAKSDLRYIAVSLAACLGTKLSSGLIAPLIAVFLVDRFGWKINKENLQNALYFLKFFIPTSIFFINPSLFFAPFDWGLFTKYADVMAGYLSSVKVNHGSGGGFISNFQSALLGPYLAKNILLAICVLFIYKILLDLNNKDKQHRFDYIYVFAFLIGVSLYLSNHIKMGAGYITNYFFSFSPLLTLPLAVLNKWGNRLAILPLVVLVAGNFYLNLPIISDMYLDHYDRYYSENTQGLIVAQKELQELVGEPQKDLNLLIDYRAPVVYSNFRKNITIVSIFDNVSVMAKWDNPAYDYILLHRDSKMLLDENKFRTNIEKADPMLKERWIASREIAQILVETGQFRNSEYEKIYDKGKLLMFRRVLK